MGCSPFANSRFQMGVTIMGFAEHFGLYSNLMQSKFSLFMRFLSLGYCGIQYSQAVPYTSPDSFDLSSVTTVSGAANVSIFKIQL